jgi:hypothetical protein
MLSSFQIYFFALRRLPDRRLRAELARSALAVSDRAMLCDGPGRSPSSWGFVHQRMLFWLRG